MIIQINTDEPIGLQIKRICRRKKIPLYKVCKEAGITTATMSNWIKENPTTIKKMFAILEAVNNAKDKNFDRRRGL
jgi:transcriptional regulator with XRE-family HTH domain